MKELLISSLLGIGLLALDLLRLRRLVLPVTLLGLAALIVSTALDWGVVQDPFGNGMMRMDDFSLPAIAILAGLALSWFALTSTEYLSNSRRTDLYALVLFSLTGAVILASCTNLVMLFLGIEILSIPLYVLAASRRDHVLSNESGFKYFFLGSVASAVLLFGIALVYGATGSFDFTELNTLIPDAAGNLILLSGVALMLAGFAFKIAAAPFHFWAPDVYQGAPTPVTALMASVVKGAAVLALFRLASGPLAGLMDVFDGLLAILAALTLVVSNLMAAVQTNVKRMLAFSGISHAGFLLAAVITPGNGPQALFYYVLSYGIATQIAFMVLQAVSSFQGESEEYSAFHGLVKRNPILAAAMTLALLSMAGIPPLAGFLAKYFILSNLLAAGYTWLVVLMILTSVVGVYYYLRLVVAMFTPVSNAGRIVLRRSQHWLFMVLSVALVVLFAAAGVFFRG